MDKAIQGVWADYGAIMITLNSFEHDATVCSLLSKMKSVKFVGVVYLLKAVLPILSTVSKCFQAGVVSFAKINPTFAAAKDRLNVVSTSMDHIKELKKDLQTNGRLSMVNFSSNDTVD